MFDVRDFEAEPVRPSNLVLRGPPLFAMCWDALAVVHCASTAINLTKEPAFILSTTAVKDDI